MAPWRDTHTDHFVDNQGCDRHVAQSSILRHGGKAIDLLRHPRRGWLGDGGIHEANGAIIILTPLHAYGVVLFLAAIDCGKGGSSVDMTGGERGGPFTPGVCCHRHVRRLSTTAPLLTGGRISLATNAGPMKNPRMQRMTSHEVQWSMEKSGRTEGESAHSTSTADLRMASRIDERDGGVLSP